MARVTILGYNISIVRQKRIIKTSAKDAWVRKNNYTKRKTHKLTINDKLKIAQSMGFELSC